MPSIAAVVPAYPRSMDLAEPTNLTERQLQSAQASVWLVMEAVRSLPTTESAKALDVVRVLLSAAKLAADQIYANRAVSTPSWIADDTNGCLTAFAAAAGGTVTVHAGGHFADVRACINGAVSELAAVYGLV